MLKTKRTEIGLRTSHGFRDETLLLWIPDLAVVLSRFPFSRRARCRQCSSLRFDPAVGRACGHWRRLRAARIRPLRDAGHLRISRTWCCSEVIVSPRERNRNVPLSWWPLKRLPIGKDRNECEGTAQSQTSQTDARRLSRLVGSSARLVSCEPRCLSRRIILRIMRRDEAAFTSGIALPWYD